MNEKVKDKSSLQNKVVLLKRFGNNWAYDRCVKSSLILYGFWQYSEKGHKRL